MLVFRLLEFIGVDYVKSVGSKWEAKTNITNR